VAQGTTVILYNHANPGLAQAYAGLLGEGLSPDQRRPFIYTHRSPKTRGEAYQLVILPGRGNPQVARIPAEILPQWLDAGGDNYANEEFFTPRHQWTAEDHRYQQPFTQREMDWRYAGPEYAAGDDSGSDDSGSEAAAPRYQAGPRHIRHHRAAGQGSRRAAGQAMAGPDDDYQASPDSPRHPPIAFLTAGDDSGSGGDDDTGSAAGDGSGSGDEDGPGGDDARRQCCWRRGPRGQAPPPAPGRRRGGGRGGAVRAAAPAGQLTRWPG